MRLRQITLFASLIDNAARYGQRVAVYLFAAMRRRLPADCVRTL
jgi:hypothetical protein